MDTLQQILGLSEQHPYYCSESNYFSNECFFQYNSFDEFLEEMGEADLDMNLLFRWDLKLDDNNDYFLQLFFIGQRKGIFSCAEVLNLKDSDVLKLKEYLEVRKEHLFKLWNF